MRSDPVDYAAVVATRGNAVTRAVFDAWDASIVVLDKHAHVAFGNTAWERSGGFDERAVAQGADYLAVCDAEGRKNPAAAEIADGVRGVLVGTMPEFRQTYPGRGDAERRWFRTTIRPLPLGGDVGVFLIHEDITDGRSRPPGAAAVRADPAAGLMERQLRAIMETIGEAICTLDGDGRITYVNPEGRRMLRASLTEPLGGSFGRWIHGLGASRPWDEPATASTPLPVACQLVRLDGSEVPIEFVATPLRIESMAPVTGWVVVFRDLSAARSVEDALALQAGEVAWLDRIRDALEHDGFALHAQPIVDLVTGCTVQHELLLRMRDPDGTGELTSPKYFLPAAEKLGVAPAIDRWVVTRGLALAALGHPVHINVSARSLEDVALPYLIEQLLAETGADPANVVFEITETALLENDATAHYFAEQVRSLGCGLALDDFGTGYGGFTYLKRFPLDYLKIDIEFVCDAVTNPASRHVIAAVVSLAAAFGLQTVAEGVEDEPTWRLLQTMGVNLAQGHLFGRPAPVETELAGPTERMQRCPTPMRNVHTTDSRRSSIATS